MLNQLNIKNNTSVEDQAGDKISPDAIKMSMYGPKIRLQKDIYKHNSESLELVNLLEKTKTIDNLSLDQPGIIESISQQNQSGILDEAGYLNPDGSI